MSDRAVVILRVLVGLAVFLAVPAVAQAATVANTNDGGPGSLRDAVATTPSGGTVDFAPGLTGTITLSTGALVINQAVTISGPGASSVTVNASLQSDRVFDIQAADTDNVTISGLTISGGSFAGNGAGIFANIVGTLTLSGDTITGNHVSVANPTAATGGGGVYVNGGRLEVDNCTITQNSVTLTGSGSSGSGGGGVYSNGGSITLTGSDVSNNTVDQAASSGHSGGGAIYSNGGEVDLTTTTVRNNTDSIHSGNGGFDGGGGLSSNGGLVSLESAGVDDNTFGLDGTTSGRNGGGGVYSNGDDVTLAVSSLDANTSI